MLRLVWPEKTEKLRLVLAAHRCTLLSTPFDDETNGTSDNDSGHLGAESDPPTAGAEKRLFSCPNYREQQTHSIENSITNNAQRQ